MAIFDDTYAPADFQRDHEHIRQCTKAFLAALSDSEREELAAFLNHPTAVCLVNANLPFDFTLMAFDEMKKMLERDCFNERRREHIETLLARPNAGLD